MEPFCFYRPNPSLDRELSVLKIRPASFWEKKGEKLVLDLFRYVHSTVPAYKKFLKKHKIDGAKIKTLADFKKLPVMDKDSYLRSSVYEELFPNRDLTGATTISATSGSTGEPFYFPRAEEHDKQYQYAAELFLRNQFQIDKYSTLGVIGFGLGIWIGGIFTYKNFNALAQKGYKITLAPVGAHKELFLKTIKKFGPDYDQVLIMGYPPFVKDVADDAAEHGVNWKDYRVRVMTAAEGFSERFRAHIAEHVGLENPHRDIVNIYGTVELGTMAHETALSYLIRHLAFQNKKLAQALWPGAASIPTLAQYYPHSVYFEQVENEVVGTGYGSSIPLIRYRFHDVGGVIGFDEMISKLADNGVDFKKEATRAGIKDLVLKLPFVYVVERSDNTVIVRGANVYASQVRNVLDDRQWRPYLTGKFSMIKKESQSANQKLEINVELKKGVKVKSSFKKKLLKFLIEDLCKYNSEFNHAYHAHPKKAAPRLKFWSYRDEKHFSVAGKHKWVKKSK